MLAVGYDGGVTEGMNEKGLAMGGLFCKTSSYKTADGTDSTPVVSLAVLVSYFLDNFATVDEVENWLRNNDFGISGKTFDGRRDIGLTHYLITIGDAYRAHYARQAAQSLGILKIGRNMLTKAELRFLWNMSTASSIYTKAANCRC